MTEKSGKAEPFINEFIPKVSRTFALAIKFLPESLRHPVYTAYLLCRLADTIEDSPQLEVSEKSVRLRKLQGILLGAAKGAPVDEKEVSSLYGMIDISDGFDHRLLGKASELFEIIDELPASQKSIIYRWAGEMAGGMAEFCKPREQTDGITGLKDIAEWDRYCYYVAGTVGHMLTDLFLLELEIEPEPADEMKRLCNSFGLGLQKVNTIKDVPDDRRRGVVFLPMDIMERHGLTPESLGDRGREAALRSFVADLIAASKGHLDDAIAYTKLIPEGQIGVRMFLVVPIFLATETLVAISKNPVQTMTGPPVKISRPTVMRLTTIAGTCSGSNQKLTEHYNKLKSALI